jgi:hypothetical protein
VIALIKKSFGGHVDVNISMKKQEEEKTEATMEFDVSPLCQALCHVQTSPL